MEKDYQSIERETATDVKICIYNIWVRLLIFMTANPIKPTIIRSHLPAFSAPTVLYENCIADLIIIDEA